MANVNDVAAAIIERTGTLDAFKFHKLVYYAQAWHLVWEGEPLFNSAIEAWSAGPALRALYVQGQFKIAEWKQGDANALLSTELETIEAIVNSYPRMTSSELEDLTRSERPWVEARKGLDLYERGESVIALDSMCEFYGALDADPFAQPVIPNGRQRRP